MTKRPSVSQCRPRRCPRCRAASRPIGGALAIVGHGARDRQLRGRVDAGIKAEELIVLRVRRFRCLPCGAVITVVPRGVARRRHFGAGSIGLAVALRAARETACEVRDHVGGTGPPEAGAWRTLRRWVVALGVGALLVRLPAIPIDDPWARLERAMGILVSHALPSLGQEALTAQAFAGGVELARAA
jgi:hypothetical protein